MKTKKRTIQFVVILIVILTFASSAQAFTRTDRNTLVVNYANTWWNARNSAYRSFDSDCANFVSQCLNQVISENSNWTRGHKVLGLWYGTSASWSVANSLRSYLINNLSSDTSGAFFVRSQYSYTCSPSITSTNGNVGIGSSVFYDWEGDGTYNHSSIGTGAGTIAQHTTDRSSSTPWSLYTHLTAAQKVTTKYSVVNVDS